jgi:hypothetical protein
MDRFDGEKLLNDLAPEKFDPAVACNYAYPDLRRLPTGVLQQIKTRLDANLAAPDNYTREIGKNGIRIIGGCSFPILRSQFRSYSTDRFSGSVSARAI